MPAELNVLAVLPNWKKLGVSCSFRKDNHWTHLPGAPNDINCNWLRDCPQYFILAFNALLVGQIFFKYFLTISNLRTLVADIPPARMVLFI